MTEAVTRPGPGMPCWVSLMAHDLPAAQRFYSEIFGWEYEPGPGTLGPYVRALKDGDPVAGLNATARRLDSPAAWLPHVAALDADRTANTVRECGGTVAVGPLDAAEDGRTAIAADIAGAGFGIWQMGEAGGGVPFRHSPGAPVWTELITSDATWASKFYQMVFGYQARTARTVPGADRLTLYFEDQPVCGIRGVDGRLPRDRGSYWLVYFSVTDADATAARLSELGGEVIEPEETPIGRVIRATDPEGAPFALLQRR
ncbi:VOC family protein [Streptomyces otsuchiensis]|uniref:VOC family protein n=1 Tax=Streptomyces otsuchiensis TaxID=2681388 RepID=UPI001032088D|nr:VOC family protein [Streptomyces otsuchiensis]